MKYDPHNHHRRSIRLKDFDYTQSGGYFITICTHNRECLFGDIANDEMRLNPFGLIVDEEWRRTSLIRNNVELDEFVVMPNHVHGIIILNDDGRGTSEFTGRGTSQRAPTMERFGKPTRNSIPTIVRLFKSATTKRINELRNTIGDSVWQRNYYEHIIRGDKDVHAIREYIINNPFEWQYDRENVSRIPGMYPHNPLIPMNVGEDE